MSSQPRHDLKLQHRVSILEAELTRNQARLEGFSASQSILSSSLSSLASALLPASASFQVIRKRAVHLSSTDERFSAIVALATKLTGVEILRIVEYSVGPMGRLYLEGKTAGLAPLSFSCLIEFEQQTLQVREIRPAIGDLEYQPQWANVLRFVGESRSPERWLQALWSWPLHFDRRWRLFQQLWHGFPALARQPSHLTNDIELIELGRSILFRWEIVASSPVVDDMFSDLLEFSPSPQAPSLPAPVLAKIAKLQEILGQLRLLHPVEVAVLRVVQLIVEVGLT